ncbi:MAG TPA: ABC transporter permease [Candidatus Dormibacteraeota bacterium]
MDVVRLSAFGLRARRTRALMSALGIAIGIAAIVGVLGVTRSSESDLLAQIDLLGTNLLVVQNGHTLSGQETELPGTAVTMIGALDGVEHVSATARLAGQVYRSELIPTYQGGGLAVRATDLRLLSTLDGGLAAGVFLNAATARYPVAVLGWSAAQTLGVDHPGADTRVWVGGRYWQVIGILRRLPLAPEIDLSVLVGQPAAASYLGFDGIPTRLYVRTAIDRVADVAGRLAPTANPQYPFEVSVSRPSDALAARLLAADASTSLFLGLGAIALLIAGVGIANVMLISVLERRSEIGLRRALGATQVHIAVQFMGEAALLALLGGAAGIAAGAGLTAGFAWYHGWALLLPPGAVALGLGAALAIGCAAGLYPALRAARLAPTDALRSV